MGNSIEIPLIPYCDDKNYKRDDIIIEVENKENVINFLNEKYRNNELCILKQPPLGNCLFESLACPFNKTEQSHKQMRKELVDYIGDNFKDFEHYLVIDDVGTDNIQLVRHLKNEYKTDDLKTIVQEFGKLQPEEKVKIYKQVMGKTTVFGTNLEIYAFAKKYRINVVVIKENQLIKTLTDLIFNDTQYNIIGETNIQGEYLYTTYIFLLYRNENHYDVIKFKPSKSLSQNRVEAQVKRPLTVDDVKISTVAVTTGKSNGMMKFALPFVLLFGTGTVFAINNYNQKSDNENIIYEPSKSVLQETTEETTEETKEETTEETTEETETRIESKDNYENVMIIVLIVGVLFYFYGFPRNKKKTIKNKKNKK